MTIEKTGKVIPFTRTAVKPLGQILTEDQQRLITLRADYARPESLNQAHAALKYASGDSILAQDIKTVVIRRIAMEAFSNSWVRLDQVMSGLRRERKPFEEIAKRFMGLMDAFPPVENLEPFLLAKWPKCSPRKKDGETILRAKREAIITALTTLIYEKLSSQGVIISAFFVPEIFVPEEGICGLLVSILKEHLDYAPLEMARCIKYQILDTESGMPFNIGLPR